MKFNLFFVSIFLQFFLVNSVFAANLECKVIESSFTGQLFQYTLDSEAFTDQGRGGTSGTITAPSKIDSSVTFNMNGLIAANDPSIGISVSLQNGMNFGTGNNNPIEPNLYPNVAVVRVHTTSGVIEIGCHILGLDQ